MYEGRPRGSRETQESRLRQVGEKLFDAWNAHDAHSFAASFTEGATYVDANGRWLRGRQIIEADLAQQHRNEFRVSKMTPLEFQVTFLSATAATLHVRWELVRLLAANGSSLPHRNGTFLFVLVDDGEVWQVVRAQSTASDQPD